MGGGVTTNSPIAMRMTLQIYKYEQNNSILAPLPNPGYAPVALTIFRGVICQCHFFFLGDGCGGEQGRLQDFGGGPRIIFFRFGKPCALLYGGSGACYPEKIFKTVQFGAF